MSNQKEQLFRGKVPAEPKNAFSDTWVYGDLIHSGDKYFIHSQGNRVNVDGGIGRHIIMHEIIPETLGEYTGLTDENGKRIFEGDIVSIIGEDEIGVVEWDYEDIKFVVIVDNICSDFSHFYGHDLVVIGNVHDNPELLEVAKC